MQARWALLYRVVQPGERLEWMQRVQAGKPLDVSQAPAKLQVVSPFNKYCHKHITCMPVIEYCCCHYCCMRKQTPHAKRRRHAPSAHLLLYSCERDQPLHQRSELQSIQVSTALLSSTGLLTCSRLAHVNRLSVSLTDAHMGILQVVYEDGHMACVVKPAGMPTAQVISICSNHHNFAYGAHFSAVTLSICALQRKLVLPVQTHTLLNTELLSESCSLRTP